MLKKIIFVCLLWPCLANAAYITDKLLAGMYSKADGSGEPMQLLTSGTPIDMLEEKNGFVKVQMVDGKQGWVEKHFLTDEKPANSRLLSLQSKFRQLQVQLDEALKGQKVSSGSAVKPISLSETEAEIKQLRASERTLKTALKKEVERLASVQAKLDGVLKSTKAAGETAATESNAEIKQLRGSESELKGALKAETTRLLVLKNKYEQLETKLAGALKKQKTLAEGVSPSAIAVESQAEIDALNESASELQGVLLETKDQLVQLIEKVRVGNVNIARLENENEALEARSNGEGLAFPLWMLGILVVLVCGLLFSGMALGQRRQDAKQRKRHGGFRI